MRTRRISLERSFQLNCGQSEAYTFLGCATGSLSLVLCTDTRRRFPEQERQPVRRSNEGRVHAGEHERVSQRAS